MVRKIILYCITILFIMLFLYTGTSKLLSDQTFFSQAQRFPFLKPIAGWLVWMIPVLELFIAVLLIHARWRLIGLYAYFVLMSLFTAYMILLVHNSDDVVCGCGGALNKIPPEMHILFNVALTILAIPAILLEKRFKTGEKILKKTSNMKKGKIILGSAAALITITSSLAFTKINRFNAKNVYAQIGHPGSYGAQCVRCKNRWYSPSGGVHTRQCLTMNGALVQAYSRYTFFTVSRAGNFTCTHPVTRVTIVN